MVAVKVAVAALQLLLLQAVVAMPVEDQSQTAHTLQARVAAADGAPEYLELGLSMLERRAPLGGSKKKDPIRDSGEPAAAAERERKLREEQERAKNHNGRDYKENPDRLTHTRYVDKEKTD